MLKSGAAATLRHARFRKNLTLEELADQAKVAVKTLVDLEAGRTNPHGHTVYRVAHVLGLDARDLFDETEAVS